MIGAHVFDRILFLFHRPPSLVLRDGVQVNCVVLSKGQQLRQPSVPVQCEDVRVFTRERSVCASGDT